MISFWQQICLSYIKFCMCGLASFHAGHPQSKATDLSSNFEAEGSSFEKMGDS